MSFIWCWAYGIRVRRFGLSVLLSDVSFIKSGYSQVSFYYLPMLLFIGLKFPISCWSEILGIW